MHWAMLAAEELQQLCSLFIYGYVYNIDPYICIAFYSCQAFCSLRPTVWEPEETAQMNTDKSVGILKDERACNNCSLCPSFHPQQLWGCWLLFIQPPLPASKPSPSNDFKVITELIISACISRISVLGNRLIFFRVVLIKRGTPFNLNLIIPRILLKKSDLLLYYLYQGYPNHDVFDFALKIAISVMLLCFEIT